MPETAERNLPQALERLKSRLVKALQDAGYPVSLSIGAAIYLFPLESVDEVIQTADRLMFLAKRQGKNMIKHQGFDIPPVDVRPTPNAGPQFPSGLWPAALVPPAGPDGLPPSSPPKNAISRRA